MWGLTLLDSAVAATEVIRIAHPEAPEVINTLTEPYSVSFLLYHFSGLYIQGQLLSTFPLQQPQPSSLAQRITQPLLQNAGAYPGSMISDFSFLPWEQAEKPSFETPTKRKKTTQIPYCRRQCLE